MTKTHLTAGRCRFVVCMILMLCAAPGLEAQSSSDTTHALRALGSAIRAESKARILFHNLLGSPAQEDALNPKERAARGRLVGLIASVGGIEVRDLRTLSRQELLDISTIAPHIYRVLSLQLTETSGEIIVGTLRYDRNGPEIEYGQTRRRYALERRGQAWVVRDMTVVEFSDGVLDKP